MKHIIIIFAATLSVIVAGNGAYLVSNALVSEVSGVSEVSEVSEGNVIPTGPSAKDVNTGTWYGLVCIDHVQYIHAFRRLAPRLKETGTPYTCKTNHVEFPEWTEK